MQEALSKGSSISEAQHLRNENQLLRNRIAASEREHHELTAKLGCNIAKFKEQTTGGMKRLTEQLHKESEQATGLIKELTVKYEAALRQQLDSLTKHKTLTQEKHKMETAYNRKVQLLSADYEQKMKSLEQEIKINMQKLSDRQGSGLIRYLLRIDRFREEVVRLGGDPEKALVALEVEELKSLIEAKDQEMEMMEGTNEIIDKQVEDLSRQMSSMKSILESMANERTQLQAQNVQLQQRLQKARGMLKSVLSMADEGDAAPK